MLTPESPGPHDVPFGSRVPWLDDDAFDKLFPKTTIDHLLSEEERRKVEHERREFEAVGRTMSMFLLERSLYPVFYESACEQMASGVSQDEIRAEMTMLADTEDSTFASIVREAYEDALAGRPPRFFSML